MIFIAAKRTAIPFVAKILQEEFIRAYYANGTFFFNNLKTDL